MSQEIDKEAEIPQMQRGLASAPSNMTVRPDNGSMCALSVIINIVGGIAILAGLFLGLSAGEHYDTRPLVPIYIAGGFLSGIFNFALAVIVDACDKYRKNHKG